MNIRLGSQRIGAWRDLNEKEKEELGRLLNYRLE